MRRFVLRPQAAFCLSLLMLAATARANTCPPEGARFERDNAGFVGTLTATGQADRGTRWCFYKVDGNAQPFASQLKADDKPLDAVPKTNGGPCPVGQRAQYKIVLTTYQEPIMAGPDAAGRCQVKTAQGRLKWLYPEEFEFAAAAPAQAPLPASLPIGSVWTCNLPGIGLFTGAYFGVIDASTYRDAEGRRGSYHFDSATGVLRLTSGSGKGLAYKRQSELNFRVLDDRGNVTGGNCVWNKAKHIEGRW